MNSDLMRILCLLFAVVMPALSGEINFSASVDRTTVGLGEPLQLTVTVQGADMGTVPKPQLPDLDGFDNLGASQSQSTSISIINGRIQQQSAISFIWTLVPKKTGELTIGPCRLVYKGSEYRTEPIKITVVKGSTQTRSQSGKQTQPLNPFDLFEEPEPEPVPAEDIFISASADRTTVYQGEQVTVTWTLWTNQEIARLELKQSPGLTGFWVDDIYQPQQLNYQTKAVRGRRYYAAVLRKSALFPTQTGELTVGQMSLQGEVVVPGFFFGSTRPFTANSEPIKIKVKPLPEAGKPASWTGGVGAFEISASLSSFSSKGGEPVSLIITVTGTGNLGLIGAPAIPEIPGLKILAPETKDNFNYVSGKLSGSRTFSYPVLPQADGRYRIPEIELGFFDPRTGSYYIKKTRAQELSVTGVQANQSALTTENPGLRVLGSDIRHIKGRMSAEFKFPAGLAVGLWTLGIIVLGIGIIAGRQRQRLLMDTGYARRTRAYANAHKRLQQAEQALKQNRSAEFYSFVRQALLNFSGDLFNIETGALTSGELSNRLTQFGVRTELINELLDTLNLCELSRFSPGAVQCDPRQILERAREIIRELRRGTQWQQ